MERQGIIVVVGCSGFNEIEFSEMLNKQLDESISPIEIEILVQEKPIFPKIIFESIEEIEAKQEKFFKKVSYQQQQKDLWFLNKIRKK